MKQFSAILFLVFTFQGLVRAQGTTSPVLTFNSDLNPASTSNLVQSAEVHFYIDPLYGINGFYFTNHLDIGVITAAIPARILLWQEDSNTNFTLIADVTNPPSIIPPTPIFPPFSGAFPSSPAVTYYGFSQAIFPTPDQLLHLFSNDFFLEIDFADTNFAGQCMLISGEEIQSFPQAEIRSPDTPLSDSAQIIAIASNNRNATVVLDGSISIAPYALPLQFSWYEGNLFLGSNPILTNNFGLGNYQITLTVDNGLNSNSIAIPLEIMTPGNEARNIISGIEHDNRPNTQEHGLLQPLKDAAMFFDRGRITDGMNALKKLTDTSYLRLLKLNQQDIENLTQFIDSFIQAIKANQ